MRQSTQQQPRPVNTRESFIETVQSQYTKVNIPKSQRQSNKRRRKRKSSESSISEEYQSIDRFSCDLSVEDQGVSNVTKRYNDLISNEDRRCTEAIRQVNCLETQTVSGEDVLQKRLKNLEKSVRQIQQSINNVISEASTLEDLNIGS